MNRPTSQLTGAAALAALVVASLVTAAAPTALASTPGALASTPAAFTSTRAALASTRAALPPIGNDVSYPECGTALPIAPAFAIVGVNGGLANELNPCLGPSTSYPSYQQSELYWAVASSVGGTMQPKAQLYVNTADPGNVYDGTAIADWPTSSSSADPYGTCQTTTVMTSSGPQVVGENSPACAWQYGDNGAEQDAAWLASAASSINGQESTVTVAGTAAGYPWWLDVETVNTWQSGISGQAMNVADLQGMVAGLEAAGATAIGAYSTATQWDTITGGTRSAAAGSLYSIPNWLPGASTLRQAEANCSRPSFTAGSVTVTQWSGSPDNDYSCPPVMRRPPTAVHVLSCRRKKLFKPRSYVITCADANVRWKDVTWSSWGERATGRGELVQNDCRPTCVAGRFHTYRTSVLLERVVITTRYGRLFSKAVLTYRVGGHTKKESFGLAT